MCLVTGVAFYARHTMYEEACPGQDSCPRLSLCLSRRPSTCRRRYHIISSFSVLGVHNITRRLDVWRTSLIRAATATHPTHLQRFPRQMRLPRSTFGFHITHIIPYRSLANFPLSLSSSSSSSYSPRPGVFAPLQEHGSHIFSFSSC